MRPDPDRVLRGVAVALLTRVGPEVRTPFGQETAAIAGTLAMHVAAETDGLANRLLEENRAIVVLASAGADLVTDAALAARLHAAAAALDTPDIRVSTLQAANDRLRALLVDLHAAVEREPGDAARALDARIWDELRESTRRRHVDLGR